MSFEGLQHTPETRARMSAAQKTRARKKQPLMGLAELVARSAPGECPFCGEPKAKQVTKPPLTCGDEICKAAYIKFYKRDARRGT